jgi:Saxitoxin biosynthesis operon protein SxtJ
MSLDAGNVEQHEKLPSDKSFGITFSVIFALVGLAPLVHGGHSRVWALLISCMFIVIAFLAPRMLRVPNIMWSRFGAVLHKIINPIILSLLFVIVMMPMAIFLRVLRVKLIPLKFDADAASYWVRRIPPGPTPESLKNQF